MIRLQRVGRKNDPSFRVVLTDSKNSTRSGKYLEILGSYDARKGKAKLEKDKIKHWLSVGAKTSRTLHNLLVSHKIIATSKLNVLPKMKSAQGATPKDGQGSAPGGKVEPVKEASNEVKAEVKTDSPAEEPAPATA